MRVEPAVPADALAAIREPLGEAGATRADAPLMQPLSLMLDLAGEAMRARLFVVQSEGGQEACLRPDFTVAIARDHVEQGRGDGLYLYEGTAFRAAGGSNRPEEFVQIGLERFDAAGASLEGDAEMAALAWRSAAAGGRCDLSLWLGDVGLFGPFIGALGVPEQLAARLKRAAGRPRRLQAELARTGGMGGDQPSALAGVLAGLNEAEAGAVLEEVWALAGIEPVGGRKAAEIAGRLVRKAEAAAAPALTEAQAQAVRDFMAIAAEPEDALNQVRALPAKGDGQLDAALDAWRRRLDRIAKAAPMDRLRFTPALGHAFDYYDGITFEVRSAALGADRAVAVGGRYDSLLARLGGGQGTGAVGCMVRPWRAFVGGEA